MDTNFAKSQLLQADPEPWNLFVLLRVNSWFSA